MEALCDEAEAVARTGATGLAVVESTAPPAISQPQKSTSAATSESSKDGTLGSLTVLQGQPTPPIAILEKHRKKHHTDNRNALDHMSANGAVTPASMADIAAAVEQVAKASPSTDRLSSQTSLDDHFRQQMIGEISQAVRTVLATELPKMLQHAISASHDELIPTKNLVPGVGETSGQPSQKTSRKKPTSMRAIGKKTTAKKTTAKKTTAKKTTAKKTLSKKRAAK